MNVEEMKRWMEYHAKRCPGCRTANFTSDNKGNHRCLLEGCGRRFTDADALPSRACEDKEAATEAASDK